MLATSDTLSCHIFYTKLQLHLALLQVATRRPLHSEISGSFYADIGILVLLFLVQDIFNAVHADLFLPFFCWCIV